MQLRKELEHDTSIDASDLAAKKYFITLKSEVDKLDVNKLVNFPTSLDNLKTKEDNLDVGKLKTVSLDLKTLNDVPDNEVAKNTKFNTPKTKLSNLGQKTLNGTTFI